MVFASSCEKDNDQGNQTNGKTTAVFNPSTTYGTMTDQDGNTYKTIVIGTQTWMAENLRTTKYRDGSSIPNVTSPRAWIDLTTGAYCNYNNTGNIDTIATYGRLYNWYAVTDSRNIAPAGWHVPTDAEWSTLINYLGGESVGDKLRETGNTHWHSLNTGTNNETGFTALPGGYRGEGMAFLSIGYGGVWWSATEVNSERAWFRSLGYVGSEVSRSYYGKEIGISVRCVRD